MLALGIHLSPTELIEAVSGALIYGVLAFIAAGVMMLFDERVMRIALAGFRSFSTVVTALYLVVLIFAAGALLLGAAFGLIRTVLNLDPVVATRDRDFEK